MIDYEHFTFAPPARTGSTWFRKALMAVGFEYADRGEVMDVRGVHHYFHEPWRAMRVTLVRHPCDWLASMYRACWPARLEVASDALNEIPRSTPFNAFVERVIEEHPGIVGRLYDAYDATVRLRTDRLSEQFVPFAIELGVPEARAEHARAMPPDNTSREHIAPVQWDPVLRQRFLDSEQACLEQYGFNEFASVL